MTRLLACTAIAYAGTMSGAQTMQLIGDNRSLLGYGSIETVDGYFDFGSTEVWPDYSYQDWNYGTGSGVDDASGGSGMNSMLSDTAIVATGSASASTTFIDGVHNFTTALGRSEHGISFRLTEETAFALTATIDATGNAASRITFRDLSNGGSDIFVATTQGGVVNIDENFLLGPGDYSIVYYAASSLSLSSPGMLSGASSYDANFRIVPAAPTAALLGLGGLLAVRRRRA